MLCASCWRWCNHKVTRFDGLGTQGARDHKPPSSLDDSAAQCRRDFRRRVAVYLLPGVLQPMQSPTTCPYFLRRIAGSPLCRAKVPHHFLLLSRTGRIRNPRTRGQPNHFSSRCLLPTYEDPFEPCRTRSWTRNETSLGIKGSL